MKVKVNLIKIVKKHTSTSVKPQVTPVTNFYTRSNGQSGFDYRMFLYKDEDNIHKASFWHDIPHFNKEGADESSGTYNTVIEIPKGEISKLEISKETFNPIKQDVKKNKITGEPYLRYYKLTPQFNYGFIPRTWENNQVKTIENYCGDNDPLDIIELSDSRRYYTGEILKVHIVGSFCLIDQDEVDWKILALDSSMISREKAEKYLECEKNLQKVRDIQHWFRVYKTYEGKKENKIYADGKIYTPEETRKVIEENHKFYMDLISCKH